MKGLGFTGFRVCRGFIGCRLKAYKGLGLRPNDSYIGFGVGLVLKKEKR